MADIVFHIRRPLRKNRGSQFYRDYSNRGQGTYCGAPETTFDAAHSHRAVSWTNLETHYVPCKLCCELRALEKQRI